MNFAYIGAIFFAACMVFGAYSFDQRIKHADDEAQTAYALASSIAAQHPTTQDAITFYCPALGNFTAEFIVKKITTEENGTISQGVYEHEAMACSNGRAIQ